ncbi:MAG TPA: hypothetical protein PLS53_12720 [Thermoanaerobaculaceae bacterium]|nr:hypothetical protein [Thermoanaerobaculaceae bacterium]HPS79013.1 hypothetical protein [Thermoanaerobaculaceae bacterium]
MSSRQNPSSRLVVTVASGILVVLAGLLVVRLVVRDGGALQAATPPVTVEAIATPSPAVVPEPRPFNARDLSIPCWSCPEAQGWPLRFRTDLDLLAPLGTGTHNAAEWYAAFSKPNGARLAEAVAAEARRVDHPPVGRVLPGDDPLLKEAEPWCDQATMRFYPDLLPIKGYETQVPNLLISLTFARSWVARGQQVARFEDAMADFRRVIRLGRLLRQEDTVLISDLVGLAIVRIGAEAIYDRARQEGKLDLALVAAVVAGEAPPQKLLSAARVTNVEVSPYLRKAAAGGHTLDLPDERLEAIRKMALESPDRRFRFEPASALGVVARFGSTEQRAKAKETLETLARSDDPVVVSVARWTLGHPVEEKDLTDVFGAQK